MNRFLPAAIAVIIVVAAAFLLLSSSSTSASGLVALQLTDPAQVPAGTQALIIDYSALAVHLSNANNASGWISASGSGSVDLLAIINLTQTIGTASIPANASINMVRFNVTSATIRINGTTYNVTVPSSKVTAQITGKTTVNGASGILLDLSPVVASIITNTSTVFVLVPSLRAVVVPGATNSTTLQLGAKVRLTQNHTRELESTRPNISITSTSLSVSSGNVTHFLISVRNNANTSVTIKHAGFQGKLSVLFNTSSLLAKENSFIDQIQQHLQSSGICASLNASASGNLTASQLGSLTTKQIANLTPSQIAGIAHISAAAWANLSNQSRAQLSEQIKSSLQHSISTQNITEQQRGEIGSVFNHTIFGNEARAEAANFSSGFTIQINSSLCTQSGLSAFEARMRQLALNLTSRIQSQQTKLRVMIFSVTSPGTLTVPLGTEDFTNSSSSYILQAGQSVTLSYAGVISFSDGQFNIAPVTGASYKVGVQSDEGGIVFNNITATSS